MAIKKKTKKRLLIILCIAVLTLLAIVGVRYRYYAVQSKYTGVDFQTLDAETRYKVTRRMIAYSRVDDGNWDSRSLWSCNHLTQFLPEKWWDILFPVSYAAENLRKQGDLALPALQRIAEEEDWEKYSIYAYSYQDDNVNIDWIIEYYQEGKMDSLAFLVELQRYLPIPDKSFPDEENKEEIDKWIKNRFTGKSYEQICLSFLDDLMRATTNEGGLGFAPIRLVRWLNRLYEYDLDQWLAKKAPEALAFRNRELKKGYDPAIAFEIFETNLYDFQGVVDEGIKAVFTDERDRRACHQLIEVIYGEPLESPQLCPRRWINDDKWKNRLRQWYWNNRDHFVYDFEKLRFEVKK